jgi:hypothetical protein
METYPVDLEARQRRMGRIWVTDIRKMRKWQMLR